MNNTFTFIRLPWWQMPACVWACYPSHFPDLPLAQFMVALPLFENPSIILIKRKWGTPPSSKSWTDPEKAKVIVSLELFLIAATELASPRVFP